MLRELKNIVQVAGEPRRRWFLDDYFDLIVWFDANAEISGFQLCYDKNHDERAVTWKRSSPFAHDRVDDGEENPSSKLSPTLVADPTCDPIAVATIFKDHSTTIDSSIAEFVYEKLLQFGHTVDDGSSGSSTIPP